MHIWFVMETIEIINDVVKYIKNAAKSVQTSKATLEKNTFIVKHKMILTIVDVKNKIDNAFM